MTIRLMTYLGNQSKPVLGLIMAGMVIAIWALDFVTGPFLALSIFYLAPIFLASWFISRRSGIALSVVCALLWLVTDRATNPLDINAVIPYWNGAVRLGFFLIVTLAVSSLRKAQERQEELMAFVVHDLRAPLANILTGLDLLHYDGRNLKVEQAQEIVGMGITSGKRMLMLINSLLDLSKLESGKLKPKLELVHTAELLQPGMEAVAILAGRQQVAVRLEEANRPLPIRADRELTTRVMVNLLSNAIRVSPAGSEVLVRVVEPEAGGLTIQVLDEGPGVPAQWQRKVFDKFEQVPARKAGLVAGSGLGLTFCKLAIEAQGGRIWFEQPSNGVERGAKVCFTLSPGG